MNISKQTRLLGHAEFYDYLDIYDSQHGPEIEELIQQMGISTINGTPLSEVLSEEKAKIGKALDKVLKDNEQTVFLDKNGSIVRDEKIRKKILAQDGMNKIPTLARAISDINQLICVRLELMNAFPASSKAAEQIFNQANNEGAKALYPPDDSFIKGTAEYTKQFLDYPIKYLQKTDLVYNLLFETQCFWTLPNESSLRRLDKMLKSNDVIWAVHYKGQNMGEACDAIIKGLKPLYDGELPPELAKAADVESLGELIIDTQKCLYDLLKNINSESIKMVLKQKELFDNHQMS